MIVVLAFTAVAIILAPAVGARSATASPAPDSAVQS